MLIQGLNCLPLLEILQSLCRLEYIYTVNQKRKKKKKKSAVFTQKSKRR